MTINAVALKNPYWDLVATRATTGYEGVPEVDGYPWPVKNNPVRRTSLTDQYAWTITDPATVAFVAEHAGKAVIDPMAGTGYWAFLLAQHGADVMAFDVQPPNLGKNGFHKAGVTHAPVLIGDGVDVTAKFGAGRTLLLSWPPYDASTGADILRAYPGNRVVYIGEGEGGCCGDGAMFDLFAAEWSEVAEHRPVQFGGMHDYVTVYERQAVTA